MAAILKVFAQTGLTIYDVIINSSGQRWNGTSFETYTSTHITSYAQSLVEQSPTAVYIGSFPSAIPAGLYYIAQYQQFGVTPDVTDALIGSDQIYWNGTTEEQGVAIVLAATGITLNPNQTSVTIGTVNALGTSALNSIASQLSTLLSSTAIAELTGIPAAQPTITQALMLLYMSLRNNHTATATVESIYNNAGSVISTASVSDDGVTFTKARFQ